MKEMKENARAAVNAQ